MILIILFETTNVNLLTLSCEWGSNH